jgi:hypothetical protein
LSHRIISKCITQMLCHLSFDLIGGEVVFLECLYEISLSICIHIIHLLVFSAFIFNSRCMSWILCVKMNLSTFRH